MFNEYDYNFVYLWFLRLKIPWDRRTVTPEAPPDPVRWPLQPHVVPLLRPAPPLKEGRHGAYTIRLVRDLRHACTRRHHLYMQAKDT